MQQVEVADVAGAGDDDGTDTDAGADDGARDKHTTASTPLPGRLLGQTQASVLAPPSSSNRSRSHACVGWLAGPSCAVGKSPTLAQSKRLSYSACVHNHS